MNIKITGRHVDATDAIREHLTAKLNHMLAEYPHVESVHAILDVQKFRHIVEIVVQAKNHVHLEAKEETDNLYTSIDKVMDKMDRQLRRSREKIVDHKSPRRRTKLSDFEQQLSEPESGAAD